MAEVGIIDDSTVYITIRIKRKYKNFLKRDVTASIGRDGVMGNRILLLENGYPPHRSKKTKSSEVNQEMRQAISSRPRKIRRKKSQKILKAEKV